MKDKEKDLEEKSQQEKELEKEIEKFKKLEEETDEMIEEEEEKSEDEEKEESDEKTDDDSEDETTDEEKSEDEESKEETDDKKEESDKDDSSNKFQKIFIVILVLIILVLGFIIVTKKYNAKHSKTDDLVTLNDVKKENKEIMNVDKTKEVTKQDEVKKEQKEKTYSKSYKKYEKLTDKQKKKTEVVPKKNVVPKEKLDKVDVYDDLDANGLPKKFNLKDKIKLKVEDQNNYSLCWAFAANNSIETNYALTHNKDLDLSEIYDDYMSSDYLFGYRRPHGPGYFGEVAEISDYFGLATEADDEYKDLSLEESFDLLGRERNLYIDYSIDFPSIYKEGNKVEDYNDADLTSVRSYIKSHIMQYGSIYAEVFGQDGKNCYSSGTSDDEWINHAVSIVGWDDTYSKNNFKASDGTKPTHDGAYIVLNSWGEGTGDKGYQYYSYDDAFIESNLAGVISVTDTKENFTKLSDYSDKVQEVIKKVLGTKITKYGNEEVVNPNAFRNLYSLDLSDMGLNNEDVRDIVQLFPDVQYLDLANNNITNVSMLADLYGLQILDLSNNKITNVSSLKNISIVGLMLDGNTNVSGYSNIESLSFLTLNNCGITELEDLSNLNLSSLAVTNNNISNINSIGTSEYISYIGLDNNSIKDLSFLKDKEIGYLELANNGITDTSALNDAKIYSVVLNNNNITELNLEGEDLQYIQANNNKITKASKNKNVVYIDLSNNNLENYDLLTSYPKATEVYLNNNNISSLKGINKLREVKLLSLDGNKISKIDEASRNIEYLKLAKNNLESLDGIAKFRKLDSLDINSNKVSDITELNKITNLSGLDIGNNKINNLEEISDSLSDIESLVLSLEGTTDVTGKIGSNITGLNLTSTSVDSIDLDSDNLYMLNIEKMKGDFDLYNFIENKNNYYIVGNDYEITEKEFNKYLETYYELNDEQDEYYPYIGNTSGEEDEECVELEDEDFGDVYLPENYVTLDGFKINYHLSENDGVYGFTDNNFRRYISNNYKYFDAPYIDFTDKVDGLKIRKTNNNYDIRVGTNKFMFADE